MTMFTKIKRFFGRYQSLFLITLTIILSLFFLNNVLNIIGVTSTKILSSGLEIVLLIILPATGVAVSIFVILYRRITKKPGSQIGLKLSFIFMGFAVVPSFFLFISTSIFVSTIEKTVEVIDKLRAGNQDLMNKISEFREDKKENSQVKEIMQKILIDLEINEYDRKYIQSIESKLTKESTTKLDFFMIFKITNLKDMDFERENYIRWLFHSFKIAGYTKFLEDFATFINSLADFDTMEEEDTDYLFPEQKKTPIIYYFIPLSNTQSVFILGGIFVIDPDMELIIPSLETNKTLLSEISSTTQSFQWSILRLTLPLILIAVLISFLITDRIVSPVVSMVKGMEEVASGDLEYKIKTEAKDELGSLVDSFNRMTEELRFSQNRLYQAEKMAAWREVAKRLAHEVKNPLTPIKLAAERIKRQYINKNPNFDSILASCTKTITSEVDRLRDLVNEFSEFARFPQITPNRADIVEIIVNLLDSYQESYPHVTFLHRIELIAEEYTLMIDEKRFKQVFINLLNNSIEAFPDPREGQIIITLKSKVKDKQIFLEISIQDNGIGISDANQHQLFTPYFSTKNSGTGLGLVIVKNIIEEHRGSIRCRSIPDKGTTFIIELPY